MRHITLLLALRLFISSAQQCVQTIDICVEQCECCDAGTDVKGDCGVSLVDRMEICSGDGSYLNDPTSYILESRSVQTEQWDVIQEGDLIFPNRIDEASRRECILVAVSMHKFHFEHRITFPNQNAAKCNPTEFSGLLLHGTCGSEAPTFIPSDNPSITPTATFIPSDNPSITPSGNPSLTPTERHDFNNKAELKIAVNLWLTNEESASSQYGEIKDWDVSRITDMSSMFQDAQAFNSNISDWNTSSVTIMSSMFQNAHAFNSNISDWNTSSVTIMNGMFQRAYAFNSNISDWNTSSVTSMTWMFLNAHAFNSNISDWNTSSVTNYGYMFQNAHAFNSNISDWNTSSVTSMYSMFTSAFAFNSNISDWNTSNVTTMNGMFYRAQAFDQVLCWDTSKVISTHNMFLNSPGSLSPNYPSC